MSHNFLGVQMATFSVSGLKSERDTSPIASGPQAHKKLRPCMGCQEQGVLY